MFTSRFIVMYVTVLLGTVVAVRHNEEDARDRVLAGLDNMELTLDSMEDSRSARPLHHRKRNHAEFDLERDPSDPFKDIDAKDSLSIATSLVEKALSNMKGSWNSGPKKNLRILSQDLEQLSAKDVPISEASVAAADIARRLPEAKALGKRIHEHGFDLEEEMDESLEKLEREDGQDADESAALKNAISSKDYDDDAEVATVAVGSDKPSTNAEDVEAIDEPIDDDTPLASIMTAEADEQKSLDDELEEADMLDKVHTEPAVLEEFGAALSGNTQKEADAPAAEIQKVEASGTKVEDTNTATDIDTAGQPTASLGEPTTAGTESQANAQDVDQATVETADSDNVNDAEKEEVDDDNTVDQPEGNNADLLHDVNDVQDELADAKEEDEDISQGERGDAKQPPKDNALSSKKSSGEENPGAVDESEDIDELEAGEATSEKQIDVGGVNEDLTGGEDVAVEGAEDQKEVNVVGEEPDDEENSSVKKSSDFSLEEDDGEIDAAVSTSLDKLRSLEEVVSIADIPTDRKTRFLNNIRGLQKDTAVLEKGELSESQKIDLQAAMKLRLSMLKDMEEFLSEQKSHQ